MLWGDEQDAGLLEFYRDLIRLRRQEPAFKQSRRRSLEAGADCLAYIRGEQQDEVLTVINLSTSPKTLTLEGDWKSIRFATEPGCESYFEPGRVRLDLPPLSGVVLKNNYLRRTQSTQRKTL